MCLERELRLLRGEVLGLLVGLQRASACTLMPGGLKDPGSCTSSFALRLAAGAASSLLLMNLLGFFSFL